MHLALGGGDLIVGVERDGEFGPMRLAVTVSGSFPLDVGERSQDCFQPFSWAMDPVPDLSQVG